MLHGAGGGWTVEARRRHGPPALPRPRMHATSAPRCRPALQRMSAYRCILTHFSQRYPKWPEGVALPAAPDGEQAPSTAGAEAHLANGTTAAGAAPAAPAAHAAHRMGGPASSGSATAAVAFDGMRVPLALLPALPALMPAVQAALADAEEAEAAEETMAREGETATAAEGALSGPA